MNVTLKSGQGQKVYMYSYLVFWNHRLTFSLVPTGSVFRKMYSTIIKLTFLLKIMYVMETVATERIKVGSIETKSHDVRGDVFILDENTLEIDYFHYDGKYQNKIKKS